MRFNPKVRDYIASLPEILSIEVAESLEYLAQFGRQAVLPDVRHRIAGIADLSETRNQREIGDRRYTIRCLVMFHSDDVLLACVAGDKDAYILALKGHDWYDDYVPVAIAIYDRLKGNL